MRNNCLAKLGSFRKRDDATQSTKAASVVEHHGHITGYTTGIAFFGHSVAETNRDLMALIGAESEFGRPGFLLPTQNHEVFEWCLEAELKLVFQRHGLASVAAMQRAGRYRG